VINTDNPMDNLGFISVPFYGSGGRIVAPVAAGTLKKAGSRSGENLPADRDFIY
jgi:hypothetical protein